MISTFTWTLICLYYSEYDAAPDVMQVRQQHIPVVCFYFKLGSFPKLKIRGICRYYIILGFWSVLWTLEQKVWKIEVLQQFYATHRLSVYGNVQRQ